jgi:antitoxin CcdA
MERTMPRPKSTPTPTVASARVARQNMGHYDLSAAKRAANVSINSDLLAQARELGVNLSQTLEEGLKVRLSEERKKRWLEENRAAIDEYNKHFEKYGLWSDGLRMF